MIGIITFHASHNCGSILQAYALQKVLQTKLQYESEIIDFQRNLSGYEEIRQMLELEKNQSLAYIERLRMVNDEPYLKTVCGTYFEHDELEVESVF